MKKYNITLPPSGKADRDIITAIDANQTAMPLRPQLNVGIVLWPEFPLLALAGLTDALRHAADMGDDSQKIRCSWRLMSATPEQPVLSSSGMAMMPDSAFVAPEQFDYIVVIGGLLRSMAKADPAARRYLHLARQRNIPLVGVCTGSFVLAQEGFLQGLTAAVHPWHLNDFKAQFPLLTARTGVDFHEEKGILTCPGGISTIGLATDLIRRHCGPDRATKAIFQMSVPNRIDGTSVAVSRAIGFTHVSDSRLRKAVFLIEKGLVKPISTQWLASEVNLSPRQLTRLFNAEFSQSPGEFIRSARLRYAHWLLINSGESVTEIALRLGFSDCAHFIRMFSREFGCTPGDCRNTRINAAPSGAAFDS